MPLLDHFNPPLNRTHPWRSFHGAWAAAMARLLNQGVLPPGYYAVPLVDRDGPIEIDVAALSSTRGHRSPRTVQPRTLGGPAPALAVAVDWGMVDDVRVEVFADDGDPRPAAAAVELVSPRNKDRPAARQAFAVKCVGYLQQGSSVVVVRPTHENCDPQTGPTDACRFPRRATPSPTVSRRDAGVGDHDEVGVAAGVTIGGDLLRLVLGDRADGDLHGSTLLRPFADSRRHEPAGDTSSISREACVAVLFGTTVATLPFKVSHCTDTTALPVVKAVPVLGSAVNSNVKAVLPRESPARAEILAPVSIAVHAAKGLLPLTETEKRTRSLAMLSSALTSN